MKSIGILARRRRAFRLSSCALFSLFFGSQTAFAVVIALDSQNSHAVFHTEAVDGAELGLNTWQVEGVDQVSQQWFWYRVGSQSREFRLDGTGPLAYTGAASADLDGDTQHDFMLVNYADAETILTPETFTVQLRYILTGGSTGSRWSDLTEVVRIQNTGQSPLDLRFFQYVDFDLNNTSTNDSVVITGTPPNTARQTDPVMQISETVVTPPPSHWEANVFAATRTALDDLDADTLSDISGPLFSQDATWAFEWDWTGASSLAPGDTVLISKDKSIRPGDHIVPEPSTIVLVGVSLLGLCLHTRRKLT
jgi:hypothetical protein